jgi:hypothetical protein
MEIVRAGVRWAKSTLQPTLLPAAIWRLLGKIRARCSITTPISFSGRTRLVKREFYLGTGQVLQSASVELVREEFLCPRSESTAFSPVSCNRKILYSDRRSSPLGHGCTLSVLPPCDAFVTALMSAKVAKRRTKGRMSRLLLSRVVHVGRTVFARRRSVETFCKPMDVARREDTEENSEVFRRVVQRISEMCEEENRASESPAIQLDFGSFEPSELVRLLD